MSTTQEGSNSQIIVFRGELLPNKYAWSPFVNKLEARLRLAQVPYHVQRGSPREAPRGKIPYIQITDAEQHGIPTTLSDSSLIITELMSRDILPDLNASLGPAQRAHDFAIRSMLEDRLYFYNVCIH